ncbi:hypothetical protein RHMOL_Rhmol05G0067600 [Rhododendron molle]|uniref:Uncharacterized protein n=1 Tax=Rhododendron molle TaxID=49168 RepID=A0ACC0NN65_RHOML|nr:hypothetical protein RHMOL_Rhmol05G0067600 [Rhododendron molle]
MLWLVLGVLVLDLDCVGDGQWCGGGRCNGSCCFNFVLQVLLYSRKRSVKMAILISDDPVQWWWGGCGSHGRDALVVFCVPKFGRRPSELSIGRGAGISSLWGGDLADEDCFWCRGCLVFLADGGGGWPSGPDCLGFLCRRLVRPPLVSTSGRGQLGLTVRLGPGGLYCGGCCCSLGF